MADSIEELAGNHKAFWEYSSWGEKGRVIADALLSGAVSYVAIALLRRNDPLKFLPMIVIPLATYKNVSWLLTGTLSCFASMMYWNFKHSVPPMAIHSVVILATFLYRADSVGSRYY